MQISETQTHSASTWQTFSAAPHRMMMFAGGLQLVFTLLFWGLELLSRGLGLAVLPPTVVPSTWVHGYLMLFGLFPYFLFGFLMTTYPRWMRGPLVRRSGYIASFLGMTIGSLLFYVAMFGSPRWLGGAVLIHALGWMIGVAELYRVFKNTPGGSKVHERYLNAYLAFGTCGMLLFGGGLLLDRPVWLPLALTIGLWGFLLPVLVTVAHRMLPFFSSVVLKPYKVVQPLWMLAALPVLLTGHVVSDQFGFQQWRFLFDLPLAVGGLYLSYRWGLRRSFEVRLLAILHLAFIWFGLGMALYAVDSLMLFANTGLTLGRAPLHALTIGLIAGMALAMASRVTLGHSGRELHADNHLWLACWGLQLSALLRILSDLPIDVGIASTHINLAAAIVWLASLLPWAIRFVPIYLLPRVDGAAG